MRPPARHASAVLDASIAASWFLPDEASDDADVAFARMSQGSVRFLVPELWPWECGNIIASAVKRRRMSASDAPAAWRVVESARERLSVVAPRATGLDDVLRLALAHGLSVYDAAYLHLSLSASVPLCTADRALARAAADSGLAICSLKDFA